MSRLRREIPLVGMLVASGLLVTLVLVACTAASGRKETKENSFTLGAAARLVVKSVNGHVNVKAGNGDTLSVTAVLYDADNLTYAATQSGDTVTVEAKSTRTRSVGGFGRSTGADIDVTAPVGTEVALETSNGGIEVTGLQDNADVRTSNGRIYLSQAKGSLALKTSNGGVELSQVDGVVSVETSNGSVGLSSASGVFTVQTSNSSINFDGEMRPGGKNRLATSNSSVRVKLRGTPSVALDASTSNSRITCELPITATTTGDRHLVGKIGAGEAELTITTSNSSITIE